MIAMVSRFLSRTFASMAGGTEVVRNLRALATLLVLSLITTTVAGQVRLDVEGIERGDPFTVSATASSQDLTLSIAMKKGWHMYARDVGGGDPVSLTVAKASCFAAGGELEIPASADGKLKGTFKLVLPLRRAKPGGALSARFSFMACDALMCLPPRDITLSTKKIAGAGKGPLKVLLVTLGEAERRGRIKTFLDERGFACTLGEYEGLTAKQCEQFDVIVADSPNASDAVAREVRKKRRVAMQFPRTKTPIVAVGFLGTELLEAHEIAMACGYI